MAKGAVTATFPALSGLRDDGTGDSLSGGVCLVLQHRDTVSQASGQSQKWGDLCGIVEVPFTSISRKLSSNTPNALLGTFWGENLCEEKFP